MERVLLHTCCAPCSLSCIEPLRSEGIEPVAFWYNPNIHPWKEYQARRDCLLAYAPTIGMEVRVQEDYGLKDFVRHVAGDIDHRCAYCYEHRLEGTAKYAAETALPPSPPPCWPAPIRITRPSPPQRRCMPGSTGWNFSTGTSGQTSGPATSGPESWGSICRSTAAASFPRRTAIRSRSTGTGQNLTRRRRPDRADELPFDAQKRPARQLPRRSFLPI